MCLPRKLALVGFLGAVVGACTFSSDESAGLADPNDNGGGASIAECELDTDCAPAASSCCECPTFALSVDSRYGDSCEDVDCQAPTACPDTRAVCGQGSCILECRPFLASACEQSCNAGYAADELGCLTCECKVVTDPAVGECAVNDDCAKVASDCCGCARGGAEAAVPVSQVVDFAGGLGCDGSAVCPEVDVCNPDLTAQCLAGTCQLAAVRDSPTGPGPPDATPDGDTLCGTSELPPCPSGQVCVLNDPAAEDATGLGLGVCRTE